MGDAESARQAERHAAVIREKRRRRCGSGGVGSDIVIGSSVDWRGSRGNRSRSKYSSGNGWGRVHSRSSFVGRLEIGLAEPWWAGRHGS